MFGLLLTSEYEYSREQKKQHMPNLEAPEDLLVCQRIKEISPEHYGEPVVVFAPTEQTALAPIPGQTGVEPAKPLQPVETTKAHPVVPD